MTLSYEDIFADFLGNVTDYQFSSLDISDVYQLMTEYLHKTLAKAYLRKEFKSIKVDDEVQTITFELEIKVDDFSDMEYVRSIIAKGMVIEWLTPQVRSKLNVSQFFAGKEQKFYSQSTHLAETRNLLEDVQIEFRKMIRDRAYIYNSYLGGDSYVSV